MSDYFIQLRNKRELIKMREETLENWRAEILSEEGDHPFVDVMPEGTDEETPKKSKKKDKEEKKDEKEDVKEAVEKEHSKKEHGNWNAAGVYVGPDRKKLKLSPDKKLRKEGYKSINPEYQYVGHSRAQDAAKKAVEKGDTEGMKRHLKRADAIKSPTRRQLDLSNQKAKQHDK